MISQHVIKTIAKGLAIVSILTGTFALSNINPQVAEAAMAETRTSVNFRVGPSTNYSIIRKLTAGTPIDVISHNSSWSRIKEGSTIGYISSSYITFTSTGLTTGTVNLRKGAGTGYSSLLKIPAGQTVQVLAGPSDSWYKVVFNNLTGYVYKSYLQVTENSAVLETPTANQIVGETQKSYTLTADTPKYMNATDAAARTNSVGTYAAGSYYIYKTSNGMMNVSKTEGQAGAWINPTAPPAVSAPAAPTDPYAGYTKMTWSFTFYTNLASENGGWTTTALGTRLRYGVLASNYWPLRSKVSLPGWGDFTIEDRGGSSFDSKYRMDMLIPRNSGESDYQYKTRVNNMGIKSITGYIKPYK